MSYAQHRKIIDADSHVIELDDFLHAAAKAEHKDLIPLMSAQSELPVVEAGLNRGRELFEKGKKILRLWLNLRKLFWIIQKVAGIDLVLLIQKKITCLDLFGYSVQWILPHFLSSDSPYRKSRSIRGRCVDSQ